MISRGAHQRARRNRDVLAFIQSRTAFDVARLSKKDIAQGMGATMNIKISERSVQRALRDLRQRGLLKIAIPVAAMGRGWRPVLNVQKGDKNDAGKGDNTPQKGDSKESAPSGEESAGCGERETASPSIEKRETCLPSAQRVFYSPSVRFCRMCENTSGWRIVERVFDGRVGKFAERCVHRDLDGGSVSAPPKRAEPVNERADSVSTSLVAISDHVPESKPTRSKLAEQLLRELWARMSLESRAEASSRFEREEPATWRRWMRENDELTVAQLDAERSMGDDSEFNPPEEWLDELRDKVDA